MTASAPFELTTETAARWLVDHDLAPAGADLEVRELAYGVSAAVVSVRGPGVSVVLKQALPRFRVADEWLVKIERAETEVAALRLCGHLTPDVVPRVLAHDPRAHVFAMELVEGVNWQADLGRGRTHVETAAWAGTTLGTWHRETARDAAVLASFDDAESFEQQRLRPFHETVMERRPELAAAMAPYVAALRTGRTCLVHGDYAMKNILVGPTGNRVVDFEVVHVGDPVFDLSFFLSFVLLSAVRWPPLEQDARRIACDFLEAYERAAGTALAPDATAVAGHTACLVLARTDGKSPAQFLDESSRERARAAGIALLEAPERGLWSWR